MEPTASSPQSGLTWLVCAAFTFCAWGLYGPLLHTGQMGMQDKVSGRFKAFLFVGVAYVLVAVLAPAAQIAVATAISRRASR